MRRSRRRAGTGRAWVLAAVLIFHGKTLGGPVPEGAAVPAGGLGAAERRGIVEGIARELEALYVIPDKVPGIEKDLREKLLKGAGEGDMAPEDFAQAVTESMQLSSQDLHLALAFDPAKEQRLLAAKASTGKVPQDLPATPEEVEEAARGNFGFREVTLLPGNVGYLDLRSFTDLQLSRDTAAAALAFLAHADAVILDLRRNGGGYVDSEEFLVGHFFPPGPVELLSLYDRRTGKTRRDFTARRLPGPRIPGADLYVLTSGGTASAAEATALSLKLLHRATLIGERTRGAGHGAMEAPVGRGFVLTVPIYYQFDPATGKGWEGVGVDPDVPVEAGRALDIAHFRAVEKLASRCAGGRHKEELEWLAPLLGLKATGPREVSTAVLARYAGKYEKIVIGLEENRLTFLGASGVRRSLAAMSEDTFLIEDASVDAGDQARVRFVSNPDGSVARLLLLVRGGRQIPRLRTE